MAKQYKFVRMPRETYEKFANKKISMERDIKELTGKNIKLTMPKVFHLVANHPVEINFSTLVDTAKKKKGGKY